MNSILLSDFYVSGTNKFVLLLNQIYGVNVVANLHVVLNIKHRKANAIIS